MHYAVCLSSINYYRGDARCRRILRIVRYLIDALIHECGLAHDASIVLEHPLDAYSCKVSIPSLSLKRKRMIITASLADLH